MLLATLWWLFFWTAIGLCVGSFLNVVIHRLPRERSLRSPLWSACPHCEARIRWYDNLPLVSFLSLRGRCRDCGVPISPRYITIEAVMALLVLLILDAFFIGHVRLGLCNSPFGLTEEFVLDWPIFLAHIILFACLLSMSAIDLEHYWVDIRFTSFAAVAGFALHVLWTPPHSAQWVRPGDTTAAVSVIVVAVLVLTWGIRLWRSQSDGPFVLESELEEQRMQGAAGSPEPNMETDLLRSETVVPAAGAPAAIAAADAVALGASVAYDSGGTVDEVRHTSRTGVLLGFLSVFLLAGLLIVLIRAEVQGGAIPFDWRSLIPLGLLFLLVVGAGSVARQSDQEILEALHLERFGARAMVVKELMWLLPAVVAGAAALWVIISQAEIAAAVREALHASTRVWGLSMMRRWAPLEGLATAAAGFAIAGALGWAVRIFFTLLFGKEAFGTGDIHLMAAAGCVAGWPVVLLGFFLTCGLALVGWVIALPVKRSRALPLGPWLSLSFLIVVIYYNRILEWEIVERMLFALEVVVLRPVGWRGAGG